MSKRYENQKLQDAYDDATKRWKRYFRQETKATRELLDKFAGTIPLIEPLFPDFFVGGKIFCRVTGGTKADFTAAVEKVAAVLGEPPTISVDPGEYCADFETHKVHVYLSHPSDCKLIETEVVEKKTVLKPHPECLAALRVLEDIA